MDAEETTQEHEAEPGARSVETKDFSFELKLEDLDEEGQFEGYAAVFNNEDAHSDIIEPGAFKKTIRESKGIVPILWQHDPWEPIGVSAEMEEDSKGLHVRGQLVLETRRGAEAHALMKRKALKGLSIGYQVVKWLTETEGGYRRRLKELKVWEFSPVTFPANPLATVGRVKSADVAHLALMLRQLRDSDPEAVKALLQDFDVRGAATPDAEPAEQATHVPAEMRAFFEGAIDHLKTKEARS